MSVLLRGEAWPRQRWRPELDGQTYRVNRGRFSHVDRRGNRFYTPSDSEGRLIKSHWQIVFCQRSGDPCFDEGFSVTLNCSPEIRKDELVLNQRRYKLIRDDPARHHSEIWDGSTVTLHFPAGQKCYGHTQPVMRDPNFIHIKGPGNGHQVDYDQFFDTMNETTYQLERRLDRHT